MNRSLTALAAALSLSAALPATTLAAKPVKLSDARYAPQSVTLLKPGKTRAFIRQCARGHMWSDFNAYRWSGAALSGQRWSRDQTFTYWEDRRYGGAVTFDGLTWRNGTRRSVLVAGWCG